MNREKRELMEHKFEKLSDANKIRYHLGDIKLIQSRSMSVLMMLGLMNFAFLLMLPFIMRYFGMGKINSLAFLGFLILIGILILLFTGRYQLNKFEKALEDFLNKKPKK